MKRIFKHNLRHIAVCGFLLPAFALQASPAAAQQNTEVFNPPRLGEVNANDVYIRCGPSENYYPMLKLQAGDRVTVVAATGKWYEILPPGGAFSLISAEYVDTPDDKLGVVNGNRVRVRASSTLEPYLKHRSHAQTMLDRGAEVQIVKRLEDGFLRIKPPAGVTVFVSRDYVALMPAGLADLENKTKGGTIEDVVHAGAKSKPNDGSRAGKSNGKPKTGAGEPGQKSGKPAAAGEPTSNALGKAGKTGQGDAVRQSPLLQLEPSTARDDLIALDAAAFAELKKPLLERNLDRLIPGYRKVADLGEEKPLLSQYAEGRIAQLRGLIDIAEKYRQVRRLREQAESQRRQSLAERAGLRSIRPPIPAGFDVKGELRTSMTFDMKIGPRRYRLIDPDSHRILAYIEIGDGSDIDVNEFIGCYVGVRASNKMVLRGGVHPVPVYTASDLVILKRPEPAQGEEAKQE